MVLETKGHDTTFLVIRILVFWVRIHNWEGEYYKLALYSEF